MSEPAYSKAGLFFFFTWLLWGDFCFMLMEVAAPALLQVSLSEMGLRAGCPGLSCRPFRGW